MKFRGEYAYVDAVDADGNKVKLYRLSWLENGGSGGLRFIDTAREVYKLSGLPTGLPIGSAEDCFDWAGMLYIQPIV